MTQSPSLSWGILGTGRIAGVFANALPSSRTGRLVAVGSRSAQSAEKFAAEHGCRAHASYEALLADPEVQAVYISAPHTEHARWAILAAQAGKHILCEKPAALNFPEAMAIAEAVRNHGVFFMEAFMYRCHPQIAKALEWIRCGELGTIRQVTASFAFNVGYAAESRLFRQDLGGGGILDVGCYPLSFARLVAGAVDGQPFANPVGIKAFGTLGAETGVDVHAAALLRFANGMLAQISTGINGAHENTAVVCGDKGTLRILTPWIPGQKTTLELTRGGKTERVEIEADRPIYSLEADAVADHLAQGQAPQMSIADTLGNMMMLDRWRKEIGLIYSQEAGKAPRPALPRLRKTGTPELPNLYGKIPGVEKPVSRMVMGTMTIAGEIGSPNAFALLDYYREHGGNCFDTAHIYGGGAGERLLGEWIRQRGVRDEVHVIVKGAHTPNCNPTAMLREFNESLERLQTDRADFYMLHRDNLEIPVGEFVDALNEQVRAGRIGLFGGSNWSLERVEEANAYAAANGLQGFGLVSNQFSLARMVEPVWAGCISASDPASRQWFTGRQMPLFAWSSQSRGFFVRAARDYTADAELVRCWYSDDNFARLERVRELAAKKGTDPIQIAAAYILHQPFPLFGLIGPWTLAEMASSFAAFSIVLTDEERRWINLEE